MVVNGHSKDILIDASGAIVEVEEEVVMDALPADVKAGLQAKAGDGKLVKVETLTKKDKLVAYEAQVTTEGGKKSEVQIGPDGKPLDHEEQAYKDIARFLTFATRAPCGVATWGVLTAARRLPVGRT